MGGCVFPCHQAILLKLREILRFPEQTVFVGVNPMKSFCCGDACFNAVCHLLLQFFQKILVCLDELRCRLRNSCRIFCPSPAIKLFTSRFFFWIRRPTPLLEKEMNIGFNALVTDMSSPSGFHGSSGFPVCRRFPANNDPLEILDEFANDNRAKKRLHRNKTNRRFDFEEIRHPFIESLLIFGCCAYPDLRKFLNLLFIPQHGLRTLGQQ